MFIERLWFEMEKEKNRQKKIHKLLLFQEKNSKNKT